MHTWGSRPSKERTVLSWIRSWYHGILTKYLLSITRNSCNILWRGKGLLQVYRSVHACYGVAIKSKACTALHNQSSKTTAGRNFTCQLKLKLMKRLIFLVLCARGLCLYSPSFWPGRNRKSAAQSSRPSWGQREHGSTALNKLQRKLVAPYTKNAWVWDLQKCEWRCRDARWWQWRWHYDCSNWGQHAKSVGNRRDFKQHCKESYSILQGGLYIMITKKCEWRCRDARWWQWHSMAQIEALQDQAGRIRLSLLWQKK